MKKGKKDPQFFLHIISDCIDRLDEYLENLSFKDFLEDNKTQDAVLRKFEVIGQAIKDLPNGYTKNLPTINWKGATGMRDLIAHHYFEIDLKLIWETIQTDLPSFKKEIKKLLP